MRIGRICGPRFTEPKYLGFMVRENKPKNVPTP